MISVLVDKQSNYPVNARKLKSRVKSFFIKEGIVSDAFVSIALVNEKKMLEISRKFLKDNKLHNVLSFTEEEKSFVYPPGKIYLGEIVVCFQKALMEAKDEEKLIDDKVYELVEHGSLHLLGKHHE
jgi:probable rRNA maturation factor